MKKFYEIFRFNVEKRFLLQDMVGGRGAGVPPAPPFLYGPEYKTQESKLEKLQILICSNDKYQDVDSECLCRSSHWRCSVRKGVLRDFAKLTGKYLCQGLFFNKVAGLSLQLYLKRESGTGVFL